jgi:hypothetical protein
VLERDGSGQQQDQQTTEEGDVECPLGSLREIKGAGIECARDQRGRQQAAEQQHIQELQPVWQQISVQGLAQQSKLRRAACSQLRASGTGSASTRAAIGRKLSPGPAYIPLCGTSIVREPGPHPNKFENNVRNRSQVGSARPGTTVRMPKWRSAMSSIPDWTAIWGFHAADPCHRRHLLLADRHH